MRNAVCSAVLVLTAGAVVAATPVLRVNQMALTDVELDLARQAIQRIQGGKLDEVALRRHAVDQLIARALLVQAARAAGLTVDQEAAEKALQAHAAQLGGEEEFARSLAAFKLERATLLRIEGERQLIARYVESVVLAGVEISDEDAQLYYRTNTSEFRHPPQVKLRMLLVQVPPQASQAVIDAAKAKAEAAAERLRKGEDFAAVARQVSTDSTAERGGELGWVRAGLLLPELEPAVWALQTGQVSEVLRSPNGFHIFKLEERREEGISSFEEVRGQLKAFLRKRAAPALVQAKVEELRATAVIEGLTAEVKQALAGTGGN